MAVPLRGKNAPKKRAPKSETTEGMDSITTRSLGSHKRRPSTLCLVSTVAQLIQKEVMKTAQIYLGLHDAFPDDDEDTLAVFLSSMYETTVSRLMETAVGDYRAGLKREIHRYRTEPLTYAVLINKLVSHSHICISLLFNALSLDSKILCYIPDNFPCHHQDPHSDRVQLIALHSRVKSRRAPCCCQGCPG